MGVALYLANATPLHKPHLPQAPSPKSPGITQPRAGNLEDTEAFTHLPPTFPEFLAKAYF